MKYLEMKSRYNVIIACSIVLLVSLQYLLLSISFNEITVKIVGNNPFISFFGTINDIVLFTFPILVFLFLVISIRFMLDILDIKHISPYDTMTMVGFSNVPLLLGMIFYNISVLFFMKENPITMKDIENIHFIFNLQIKDYSFINKICWLLMYYMIIMCLFIKYKVPIIQSLTISIVPTLLFLLFSYMIKFIGSI